VQLASIREYAVGAGQGRMLLRVIIWLRIRCVGWGMDRSDGKLYCVAVEDLNIEIEIYTHVNNKDTGRRYRLKNIEEVSN
jgi:hypothetical protein